MRFLKSILKKTFGMSFVLVLMLLVAGCGEKLPDQKARSQEEKEILFSKKMEEIDKLRSLGDPESIKKAMQMEIDNANAGSAMSSYVLSSAYQAGDRGFPKDSDKSIYWLKRAEELSSSEESYGLGVATLDLLKDEKAAFRWFELSAEKGHRRAACLVAGEYLFKGHLEGVRQFLDMNKDKEDPMCDYIEGGLYMHPSENEKSPNFEKAFYFFKRSAEKGVKQSQFIVGTMYIEGNGVEKNEDEGIRWIQQSANQGYEDAQVYLKKMK